LTAHCSTAQASAQTGYDQEELNSATLFQCVLDACSVCLGRELSNCCQIVVKLSNCCCWKCALEESCQIEFGLVTLGPHNSLSANTTAPANATAPQQHSKGTEQPTSVPCATGGPQKQPMRSPDALYHSDMRTGKGNVCTYVQQQTVSTRKAHTPQPKIQVESCCLRLCSLLGYTRTVPLG
jgi:hypothetical protein